MILVIAPAGCPTSSSVTSLLRHREVDLVAVTPEEILDYVRPDDAIPATGPTRIRWALPGGVVDSADTTGVLCLCDIPFSAIADRFSQDDAGYACAEWNAYLWFALAQFTNVISCYPPAGSDRRLRTLAYQWQFVGGLQHDIAVPRSWFGPWGNVSEVASGVTSLIVTSDPFEYDNWAPSKRVVFDAGEFVLAYERPAGRPVEALFLDGHVTCRIDEGAARRRLSESPVNEVTRALAENLGVRLLRARLFYADASDAWTFACASPYFGRDAATFDPEPEFIERLALTLCSGATGAT